MQRDSTVPINGISGMVGSHSGLCGLDFGKVGCEQPGHCVEPGTKGQRLIFCKSLIQIISHHEERGE